MFTYVELKDKIIRRGGGNSQIHKQIDRQTDKPTNRKTDRQTCVICITKVVHSFIYYIILLHTNVSV